jgi:hypothetical protein
VKASSLCQIEEPSVAPLIKLVIFTHVGNV